MNKKGQEMSTSIIILIVLGLIVLVILAIGFMMGWENVAPWLGSKSNVEDVTRQCSLACSKESKYDYCSKTIELVDDKKNKIQGATCNLLSGIPTFKTKWGIENCPTIECDKFVCEVLEDGDLTIKENILKDLVINDLKITGSIKLIASLTPSTATEIYYDLSVFANDLEKSPVCELKAEGKKNIADEKETATKIVLK